MTDALTTERLDAIEAEVARLREALAAERERNKPLHDAVRAVTSATCAYLPPDGIDAKECISRVLAATDNPVINAAMGL